ncbi:MAG: hypothetical protein AAF310_00110 [Myxococcota bacterium]
MAKMLIPLAGKRAMHAYSHVLNQFYRMSSDCNPHCPLVDVWQYQYKPPGQELQTDTKPIASRQPFWKAAHEARIIATTLYGNKKVYLQGLLDYLDSFHYVKQVNNITDPFWGYETFTMRVYVAQRNPKRLAKLGPIKNATDPTFVQQLLDRGVEIAYVDNALPQVGRDATFWRFLVTAEPMPAGQRIRYLLRDVDWKLTAAEAFTVGEWIHSGLRYHRMHLLPVCMGPLTASIWGGSHEAAGPFADMLTRMQYFPYRFEYGDDELFLREMVWPHMKASGSVLTHVGSRKALFKFTNPYKDSCQEPTKKFCQLTIQQAIKEKQISADTSNQCQDKTLPQGFCFPVMKLAHNNTLQQIIQKAPQAFLLPKDSPRVQAAIKALTTHFVNTKP